ncbi:maleylpyruvate isomerase family mycothiol-dependent enzyme [Oryzobacter telluris]|uniref:maleylpyruvate isomerase family mycothiol-dependent enzyme n=1 Tax=Oryzobacter telluris TaxID=3149179 RepID=UPI00370D9548
MTTPAPTVQDHLAGIADAARRMAARAREAGTDAPVPTCPGWTVRDLLAHQGMVHRWATAVVRGADVATIGEESFEAEGLAHPDPAAWLEAGAADLLSALEDAPDDLDVLTFLVDAPPARAFWARRQCHETTVHALDALSAARGRRATADDLWLAAPTALDGVDELLVGFWQRRKGGPRADPAAPALVEATTGARWLVEAGPERARTRRLAAGDEVPQGMPTVRGTPADLYLALWNRGGTVDDPAGLLEHWHATGAITW